MSVTTPSTDDDVVEGPDKAPEAPAPAVEQRRPPRWTRTDSIIALVFALYAWLLFSGLWTSLTRSHLVSNVSDQTQWEWFFSVVAEGVRRGEFPLYTTLQNAPNGVNLMANTVMFGMSVPLAPITWLFGPTVTLVLVLTAGLAGTATAWYWVFSRHLVAHRAAAVIGGAYCGFAPPMISHANAHANFVAGFVLPFIMLFLIRILGGKRPLRDGLVLGVLTAYQVMLGEELLFIFGVALFVFAVAFLAPRWREVPGMLQPAAIGFGTGTAVVLVLVAYPLYWQFFGPGSYSGIDFGIFGNDTASLTRFASQSIGGFGPAAADVAANPTEENGFFGWPLIILLVVVTVWLRRDALVRSSAIAAVFMAWLSVGTMIVAEHVRTGVPGPWTLLGGLPLFDTVLISRFALGCVPAIGAMIAIATDRVFAATPAEGWTPGASKQGDAPALPVRLLWIGALVAVLLPAAPTGLPVDTRPAVPPFITTGQWREYVAPDGVLVPVPLTNSQETTALRWQVQADLGFRLPEGYFMGPKSADDPTGRQGPTPRPTAVLLQDVRRSGVVRPLTPLQRQQARDDLRYWQAQVVVLAPGRNDVALRRTVDDLLGMPSRVVGGVWLWDVRGPA